MSIYSTHDRPVVVDWWRVVTDLMQQGLSHREIGTRCGVDKATITMLRNGAHRAPSFGTGVRLLALWMDVCERQSGEVPQHR